MACGTWLWLGYAASGRGDFRRSMTMANHPGGAIGGKMGHEIAFLRPHHGLKRPRNPSLSGEKPRT